MAFRVSEKKKQNLVFLIFFIFMGILSVAVHKDYGISVDEPTQYGHLLVSGKKIFSTLGILNFAPKSIKSAPDLETYDHKYYGVSAQYPLLILEFFPQTFSPNLPAFWYARHLYTRAFFLLSGFALLKILKKITSDPKIIFIGLLLYFLHPRIWADSFYNIKDSVFLSLFVVSTYLLIQYLESQKTKYLWPLAFVSALGTNVRVMGLLIPAFLVLWQFLTGFQEKALKPKLKSIFLFAFLFAGFLYILWPALWGAPVKTFIQVFFKFANYDVWNGAIKFAGIYIPVQSPPKIYLPVIMSVTTPIIQLILWLIGIFALPIAVKKSDLEKPFIFYASLFFVWGSYLAIIIMGSTLYSGWRHVEYIFASLVILSVYSLEWLKKKFSKQVFNIILGIVFVSLLNSSYWIAHNHPFQYVYFNFLAGRNWEQNWEHDYWWVSSKQLLDFLTTEAQNGTKTKHVTFCSGGTAHIPLNLNLIPLEERTLLNPSCAEGYEYFLYNSNILGDKRPQGFSPIYEIKVDGQVISAVYQRNKE